MNLNIKRFNFITGFGITVALLFDWFYLGKFGYFYIDTINFKYLLIFTALLFSLASYSKKTPFYAVMLLLFIGLNFWYQIGHKHALVTLEMQSSIPNELAVYWGDKSRQYNENRVSKHITTQENTVYRSRIACLQDINYIRIDPLTKKGNVSIKNIKISEFGYNPILLNAQNNFFAIDLEKNSKLHRQGDFLVFSAENADDFLEIRINRDDYQSNYILVISAIALLFLAYLNIINYAMAYQKPNSAINLDRYNSGLGLAIMLVLITEWFYLADVGYYFKDNYLIYNKLFTQWLLQNDLVPERSNIRNIFYIHKLDMAYIGLAALAFIILALFSKHAYLRYFCVFLLVLGLLYLIPHERATSVSIKMHTSENNFINFYWADESETYIQNHSISIKTSRYQAQYRVNIANLNNVHNLRVEPISTKGKVVIEQIEINEPGYQNIILNSRNHFFAVDLIKKSKKNNEATAEKLKIEKEGLVFETQDGTDYFEIILEPKAFESSYDLSSTALLIGLLSSLFLLMYYTNLKYRYLQTDLMVIVVRFCLALVLVMIVQLAWFSEYDLHPDERAHIESIEYYTQYSDPPSVGDIRAINTYQVPWGYSRLDDLGISYFLMGKFKNIMTRYFEDSVFICRLFNSLLFATLLILSRSKLFALFCIPILCLPQVWYLFSYANRDSFAFFLALLLGWQIIYENSLLNSYFQSGTMLRYSENLWLPALLLGLLSIEVSNYAAFIVFCVTILVWRGLSLTRDRKQFFLKCLVFVLLAGSVYGVRKAIDIDINGFNKQEQRNAFQEAIADAEFKPSVAGTDKGFFGLRLQKQGINALELFDPRWEWQTLTFKSFTGLYGNIRAEWSPEWFYSYVMDIYILIAVTTTFMVIRYGTYSTWIFSGLTLLFVFGDVLMGFLYSWFFDFQPQGRYIFPLIPMLMMYFYKMVPTWGIKSKIVVLSCVLLLLVLSLFSFREIALKYMMS